MIFKKEIGPGKGRTPPRHYANGANGREALRAVRGGFAEAALPKMPEAEIGLGNDMISKAPAVWRQREAAGLK